MKAIVIMLHNHFNEKIVSKQFVMATKERSEQLQIISIPMPVAGQSLVVGIERLKAELKDKVDYNDVCAFVIESNYGYPSHEEVNFDILQFGLTTFLNAKIIAYSSTQMSLVMGAKLDDNISVCHSSGTSLDEIVSFFAHVLELEADETERFKQRVFTRSIAKELTKLIVANENLNLSEPSPCSKTLTFQFKGETSNSNSPVIHAKENSVINVHCLSGRL